MTLENLKKKTVIENKNGKQVVTNASEIIQLFMMMPVDERKQISEEYTKWLGTLSTK